MSTSIMSDICSQLNDNINIIDSMRKRTLVLKLTRIDYLLEINGFGNAAKKHVWENEAEPGTLNEVSREIQTNDVVIKQEEIDIPLTDCKQEVYDNNNKENSCATSFFQSSPRTGMLKGIKMPQGMASCKITFTCQECMKSFPTLTSLKTHQRVHNEEKHYNCQEYYKSFSYRNNLRLQYSNGKRYRCKECYKTFSLVSSLKYHQLLHAEVKPYKCEECSETFSCVGKFRLHQRVHSGEKLNKCEECCGLTAV